MSVGSRIKAAMKERGLSQNKLAKAAQISQSGLSSILSGASSPKENTLRAIADALGVTVAYLTGEEMPEQTEDENEAWEIRERIRRDKDFKLLYEALIKAPPEHIRAAHAMIQALKNSDD